MSGITLTEVDDATIPTPASGKSTIFLDDADGAPKYKDDTGSVHTLKGDQGDPGAPGGDVWMVAGHYIVQLTRGDDGWAIAGITLQVFYQEGNLRIPQIARERATASRSADA